MHIICFWIITAITCALVPGPGAVPADAGDPVTILFLGDSITAGYGIDTDQAFPALINQRLLERTGRKITVINAGISGSTTASAVSRLKWHARQDPDILVLALGANDGLRGLPIEAMEENLEKAIKMALDMDIKVILAGMEVPPNYGADYARDFRSTFTRLSQKYDIVLMPFLLKNVAGIPDLNLPDGIHPGPGGHQIIADTLLPYILELL